MTTLSDRMRLLAHDGHERAVDLERLADEFDRAAEGYYALEQTVPVKQFCGAWARARLLWRDCTGEHLF